ncbi:alpha-2-macroglobulin family protein [Geomesophilobacter sediminis]|uniref:Alpha-2-macroglobulin n=1 Tax=Geomesophilobacter sediminis TaxID=2798584 RepID=A0A8J7JG70_9BACT|nr:MG2 domain-containing protein [Geomesophilobacter sediminis]MBJ6723450.1 hypothetical protein [Geomesophilobacter sediminis]
MRLSLVGLAMLLIFAATAAWADSPRVERFSPTGRAKGVRQVAVLFSEPMTTFGDPRNDSPFDISCPEKGSGRWVDVSNWVFDFDRDVPAGVSCLFTLKDGLKSASGLPVGGERSFSFSTGGPGILHARPSDGKTIEEDQIFILDLDGAPDEASVLGNVRFAVEGLAEPVGAEIVKGTERATVLKAAGEKDLDTTLLLRCRQRFPSKAAVKLIWGAGVRSVTGLVSDEQVVNYTVQDSFTVTFKCERTRADAACLPMTPMQLRFSAPVPTPLARKIVLKSGKRTYRPKAIAEDEESTEESATALPTVRAVKFEGPFPEHKSLKLELPAGFADEAGRRPANADKFPLKVTTDGYPPLAKFAAPFGIVEWGADAAIPVTLRNLEPNVKGRQLSALPAPAAEAAVPAQPAATPAEGIKGKTRRLDDSREEQIIQWLRKVREARREKPLLKGAGADRIVVPKPNGEKAFEVVGIPVKKPGFYVVELESPILGAALLEKKRPMFVSSAALVTNLSAHFKKGHESSLVWVTSLDKGEPVAGAAVTVRDCKGKLYWRGTTDAEGIARIGKKFPEQLPYCSQEKEAEEEEDSYSDNNGSMLQGTSGGLFVFARRNDDLTLVHTSWDRGIESWRFNLPGAEYREHTIAHTVFDRTLVRAGETVHMKHFMRNHVMKGFALRKPSELPQAVVVQHRGSGQTYEFPLSWHADNSAESTMTVPKGAELGFYDVYLTQKSTAPANGEESDSQRGGSYVVGWNSGFFRVEAFRVPLMRGVVEPPKEPAVNATAVDVDLYVAHLSGGGAGGAPVKLRTRVAPRSVHFDDYEEYTFANGKVQTGVVKEDYQDPASEGEELREDLSGTPQYRTQEFVLDKSGAYRARIGALPTTASPQTLLAELEFRDPNGEIQTVTGRIPLWSSKLLVGIKPQSWTASGDSLEFSALVLDLKGRPVPGAKVDVELFRRKNFSHRKRLVGGFYSYEHVTETKGLGAICSGTTDGKGLLHCSGKPASSGNLILQATVVDDAGNVASANQDVWVAGKDEWWFETGDSDRIDLLPEKKAYEPGEVAKFQVRSPFRSATVLVAVEREGVIEAHVQQISGKQPIVSVPIKGSYAPNVFVSALCVRGRLSGTKPTALFDPGKPSYRLGIAEVRVGSLAHELQVKVTPDRPSYQVRGKAQIAIKVVRADGGRLPKGAEVAVAAVDEGLLELMPNNSWKLLEAMLGRRGYEVETATAQTQVVGRRHFGLKALPAGGGGGMRSARELFDTLLAWKGRVKLDENGEATVEIPLNDSLTSFAVVAVADAGPSLFGTGRTTIRTTQDLMVLSGLPPVVRQGDWLTALFTVRNASNRAMSVSVAARPSWEPEGARAPVAVELAPGEAKELSFPVEVPGGIEKATWEVRAREEKGPESDTIKVTQQVLPAVPVQVYQATLAQVDRSYQVGVRRPEQALKGRGGLNVTLRPKLAGGLDGVTRYMRNYPYSCMEQMVSRAIALKDDALWKQVLKVLPSYLDSDGLVRYFPSSWLNGSPTLTAYLLSITNAAGRELPVAQTNKMLEGLRLFVEGKIRRESAFRTADRSLQKLAAIEALGRRGRASNDLVATVTIEPKFWPTSALLDWLSILKTTRDIPNRSQRLKEAGELLRSRLNLQGSALTFSTERSDELWWLMVSTDANAVRALLTLLDEEGWQKDLPRLARGAVARQTRGHWETTVANAWGVVALDAFSKKFEAAPVAGATTAELAGTRKTEDWGKDKKGKTLSFGWPDKAATLVLQHEGSGKPWATVLSLAAIPLKEQVSSGYHIKKSVVAVERRIKNRWSRGDVARVRLEIDAQSDMTWVAVSDPIPAGATILGSGLGRDSDLLTAGEKNRSWPVFDERGLDTYRAYYEFVPKGKLVVEYTVRFNNEGKFRLPPTRVEALYLPEMFGESPNAAVWVEK